MPAAIASTMDLNPEGWIAPKKILVILAHPDDPEFFCGAAIARWCELGHKVSYCLLTKGQRGTSNPNADPSKIAAIRMAEQINAGNTLGVTDIRFLEHMDGDLVADLKLRAEIIHLIRNARPDIIVTSDPTNLFPAENRINHPDHRAAGQVVLDAIFPAVGNPGYKIGDGKSAEGSAHRIEEVWLTLTCQANFSMNLTLYLDKKIEALLCHRSQILAPHQELKERLATRFEIDPVTGEAGFMEKFKRIVLT